MLYRLAAKLTTNNTFKILYIRDNNMFSNPTNKRSPIFDGNAITITGNTYHRFYSEGHKRIIDIVAVLKNYDIILDEFKTKMYKYDIHELRFSVCSLLSYNEELKVLDLSHFNCGFHQNDFNNICQTINNSSFINMFGITGRSENYSMIENLYYFIKTTTYLTEIKLTLIYDTNDFGSFGYIDVVC